MYTQEKREFKMPPDGAPERLDKALTGKIPDLSRNRIQSLIHAGQASLNGVTVTDPGYKVKPDSVITLLLPPPVVTRPEPEKLPIKVVYEDLDLIVIDKAPGMVVHPAPGNRSGTLVNALLAHCGEHLSGIGGERRPGIVHRLDKDTSGLIVVAKNDFTHQGLSQQFASHGRDGTLKRKYQAIVWGKPERPCGTINASVGRSRHNPLKQAVVQRGGKKAITHFETLEVFSDAGGKPLASLLMCHLETGRTHQIRVHMHYKRLPLLGDREYAGGFETKIKCLTETASQALQTLNRQALHAKSLSFVHPRTRKLLELESPLPEDLQSLITALRAQSLP